MLPLDALPIKRVYELLSSIAHKWRLICEELHVDTADVKGMGETDSERLRGLIRHHAHQICQKSTLQKVLTSPAIQEYDLAMKANDPPILAKMASTFELERNTKKIKLEFSHLLSAILKFLKEEKLPRDLVKILGCYSKIFLELDEHCRDSDDIMLALIAKISFLDYDLLEFLARETGKEDLTYKVKIYTNSLKTYLSERIFSFQSMDAARVTRAGLELRMDKEMDITSQAISKLQFVAKELLQFDVEIDPTLAVSDISYY